MYLRCFTGDQPRQWLRCLPWAEFVFNTAYQTSLRDTPFRVVCGRNPPSIRSYELGDTKVAAVAKTMEEREEFLTDIRLRLEQAQATQKMHYDKVHHHISYQVGDWALLRLRQRATSSLPQAVSGKLKPRFFGPYQVVELINEVAVRLALPPVPDSTTYSTSGSSRSSMAPPRSPASPATASPWRGNAGA
jgi:hypothetical protein